MLDTDLQPCIARGRGDGGGPPRAAKLRVYLIIKKLVRGKVFLGGKIIGVVKKILGYDTKISSGAKFKDRPGQQTP